MEIKYDLYTDMLETCFADSEHAAVPTARMRRRGQNVSVRGASCCNLLKYERIIAMQHMLIDPILEYLFVRNSMVDANIRTHESKALVVQRL